MTLTAKSSASGKRSFANCWPASAPRSRPRRQIASASPAITMAAARSSAWKTSGANQPSSGKLSTWKPKRSARYTACESGAVSKRIQPNEMGKATAAASRQPHAISQCAARRVRERRAMKRWVTRSSQTRRPSSRRLRRRAPFWRKIAQPRRQ